ncbi:zinc-binding dehydrogenase [Streptomonospora nanhaiensis]|uniref:zinc-binding dehydrogenase n=1 Tax=Streptomonospora nanhaiensis TaxID=1323731 RepID=UPI001C395C1E|nr:zinc-binding dehydrogenase [Streptomonospora nanhaiensis]MBV2363834.1 zinc-binding dehydrogenase [Streptomonospora nanhaiensis]MBX9389855.1 zinc-binding dehydrogenase [Streptomonospora nanhaiensis]
MTATMRAQRFHKATRQWAIEEVPVPDPGPGEVLVKVAYCGICHSDLSLIDGVFGGPEVPDVITQGHEAAGTIARIGPGVTGWAEGDRVIPAAGRPCGVCEYCRRADFGNCSNILLMAFAYDGAWAEYTVAQAVGLTRVPDSVPLEQAALLADAVSTPFGAVVRTGRVGIGEAVGVWGVGGVGTHIVQLARLVGANPIVAFDLDEEIRGRAIAVGADFAFDSRDPDVKAKVAEVTKGHLLDVAFDAVGIKATFEQGLDLLTAGGRIVGVGLSAQEVSLGTTAAFGVSRKQALGHLGYKNEDIGTLVDLVAAGRLDLSRSISGVVGLDDLGEGIRRLHEHEGNPIRILVRP